MDETSLQHLMKRSYRVEDNIHTKTGVHIILIVQSNMSCINVLTHTDDLSINRKFGVYPYARLKSLLHLSDFKNIYKLVVFCQIVVINEF